VRDIHITHIRHLAGDLEEGMQLCRLCGEVLLDYTNAAWSSPDGSLSKGFPSGFLYVSGNSPTVFSIEQPKSEEVFEGDVTETGEQIKYINKIILCDKPI
jgi:hypothetical protein